MKLYFAPSRKLAAHRLAHGGPRVYDPRERLSLALLDGALWGLSIPLGLRPRRAPGEPREAKRILALRLDRLGDLVTTLPALAALRLAAPDARIELGVGSWNEPVARSLPFVDALRVIDTPWASWGRRVRFSDARRALGDEPFDLAIDFQGDVRVLLLMALSRAGMRAGYGETGGGYLLTHRAPWDESRSWYWQNMELVRTLFPNAEEAAAPSPEPFNFLLPADREKAGELLATKGPREAGRPLIGIQPSAGRALKQWEEPKFSELIDRLTKRASVVLTGSEADRPLVERIAARAETSPDMLLGADLRTFAALVERFDVFVTGDTGPMHVAHAVGTPNVAIFGPSDPVRYGPDDRFLGRIVVRQPVYCSPCNMIRRPPRECSAATAPDCIAGITVGRVEEAVHRFLRR